MDQETLDKAYLGAAVLFFLFLIYTAVSAEHARTDLLSDIAVEPPPETHSLVVYSVDFKGARAVKGALDGAEIDANRLDLPKCAASRKLVLDAERGVGLTIFSNGVASKLVPPSRFEEFGVPGEDSGVPGDSQAETLYQVAWEDAEDAVFPWPLGDVSPTATVPASPASPFLAFA